MLNRTNRTLSANTNRLNLGTRKLALIASANNGSLTLRTVPMSPDVHVRTGVVSYQDFITFEGPSIEEPKPMMKPEIRPMSGSSLMSSRPAQGFWAWDQGQTITSAQFAQLAGSPLDLAGTGGRVTPQVSSLPSPSRLFLDGRCDRPRQAGRSARAALAMVTGASPAS